MSESLKSWLFSHVSSQAGESSDAGFDISDMPYLAGNRIQILRFMTFRPTDDPNSKSFDVWALVGDRTHCIAARFAKHQVDKFHRDYPMTFTSLKGALVTLTHVRVTVAKVQTHLSSAASNTTASSSSSLPYTKGQYAIILDVRGFEVVSSVNEPVWFSHVKLVTSKNCVPPGQEQRWEKMVQWMKTWARYKSVMNRARAEHKASRRRIGAIQQCQDKQDQPDKTCSNSALPTPAQRKGAVLQFSQVQNATAVATAAAHQQQDLTQERINKVHFSDLEESMPTTCTSLPVAVEEKQALWNDFDLDAQIGEQEVMLSTQWASILDDGPENQLPETSSPAQPEILPEIVRDQDGLSQRSTQTRVRTGFAEFASQQSCVHSQGLDESDPDPDESGISDYERESRKQRRAKRRFEQTVDSGKGSKRRREEQAAERAHAPTEAGNVEDAEKDSAPQPATDSLPATEAEGRKQSPVDTTQKNDPETRPPRIKVPMTRPTVTASTSTEEASSFQSSSMIGTSSPMTSPTLLDSSTTADEGRKARKLAKKQARQRAIAALMATIVD